MGHYARVYYGVVHFQARGPFMPTELPSAPALDGLPAVPPRLGPIPQAIKTDSSWIAEVLRGTNATSLT